MSDDTVWIKKDNVIQSKSFGFAVRIVKLCAYLKSDKLEYVIAKQLLRSGTSIGANVRESARAESRADFAHKMSIAQKEADETQYWLELLRATDYLTETEFTSINNDVEEIIKILSRIIISTKQNSR